VNFLQSTGIASKRVYAVIRASGLPFPCDWRHTQDAILLTLAAGLVLLITWSCSHGLDLFDESLYLLETIAPSDSIVRTTAAPLYLHSLFAALNYDVTSLRVAGISIREPRPQ
jgi:hypothetical protein